MCYVGDMPNGMAHPLVILPICLVFLKVRCIPFFINVMWLVVIWVGLPLNQVVRAYAAIDPT